MSVRLLRLGDCEIARNATPVKAPLTARGSRAAWTATASRAEELIWRRRRRKSQTGSANYLLTEAAASWKTVPFFRLSPSYHRHARRPFRENCGLPSNCSHRSEPAVCVSSARTDLCGGRLAMIVPTATAPQADDLPLPLRFSLLRSGLESLLWDAIPL